MLKKRLGQHLLLDRAILEEEARLLDCEGESVLEIGAGDGRLTRELLRAGASKVTAVEMDREMVARLNRNFHSNRRVDVVHADFLELPPGEFGRVAGNIPYYISSPIVFRLLDYGFGKAVLCVQKEFAQRMVAKPGEAKYGRLGAASAHYFEAELLLGVPKESFAPVPKVDSAVISLKKRRGRDEGFERVSAILFSHRLKTVRAAILSSWKGILGGKAGARALGDSVKYHERRVFTLSDAEIGEIARAALGKMVG